VTAYGDPHPDRGQPPDCRAGLTAVLATLPDFAIVGEAANGVQAVERAATLHPDVIVLDLELPEVDGAAVIQAIRAADSAAKVIVFTALAIDEGILSAVRAGAQAYVLKGAPREQLFQAIHLVQSGGSLMPPVVAAWR
jgi:DNA-binding NarL/FixJ family response regulator